MPSISTRCYALVVVEDRGRFALVQEADTKHWYLPAGRVEPGESFMQGALRETREEAGLEIDLTGIIRVEHTPMPDGSARLRVIFAAKPCAPGAKLKDFADEHSVQARWVTFDEARKLTLRGNEVLGALRYVADRRPTAPLTLLTAEGAPYPT